MAPHSIASIERLRYENQTRHFLCSILNSPTYPKPEGGMGNDEDVLYSPKEETADERNNGDGEAGEQ